MKKLIWGIVVFLWVSLIVGLPLYIAISDTIKYERQQERITAFFEGKE